jgi:formyl-CoA transferase
MLVEVEQAGCARKAVYAGTPIKLTATPGGVYRRPPRLGEHTAEILGELGIASTLEPRTREETRP